MGQPPDIDRLPAARVGVNERPASPRELAVAAGEHGTKFRDGDECADHQFEVARQQFLDNVLASPQGAITGEKFERFDVSFVGAGDTLVGRACRTAGLGRRAAHGGRRRGADLPRPGAGRGFPPWHGQRRSPTASSGPCPRATRKKAKARPTATAPTPTSRPTRAASTEKPQTFSGRSPCAGVDALNQRRTVRTCRQACIPGGVNSPCAGLPRRRWHAAFHHEVPRAPG